MPENLIQLKQVDAEGQGRELRDHPSPHREPGKEDDQNDSAQQNRRGNVVDQSFGIGKHPMPPSDENAQRPQEQETGGLSGLKQANPFGQNAHAIQDD